MTWFEGAAPWMESALCRQTDPEVFFPEAGEPGTAAKAICRRCPVREACLDLALERREVGVWGGLGTRERDQLRSRRKGVAA